MFKRYALCEVADIRAPLNISEVESGKVVLCQKEVDEYLGL